MIAAALGKLSPRLSQVWDEASVREQRMVMVAVAIVLGAIAWTWIWQPMQADIARMQRDQPRERAVLALARAQALQLVALQQANTMPKSGEPRAAVERVLAAQGLRSAASSLDVDGGRVRLVFAAVRFDTLVPALDALLKADGLRPVEMTLTARVEPGTVRAEIVLAR